MKTIINKETINEKLDELENKNIEIINGTKVFQRKNGVGFHVNGGNILHETFHEILFDEGKLMFFKEGNPFIRFLNEGEEVEIN